MLSLAELYKSGALAAQDDAEVFVEGTANLVRTRMTAHACANC